MKKSLLGLSIACIILSGCIEKESENSASTKSSSNITNEEYYAVGYTFGAYMKNQGLESLNKNILKGLKDSFSELSLEEKTAKEEIVREDFGKFRESMRKKMEQEQSQLGDKNKQEGITFLNANKEREGVNTLENGIQYEIISSGQGTENPSSNDEVTVHYKGTLINGTEFDSSYARQQPMQFQLNRVIKGWQEILQVMTIGDKWKVYIPSDLAYGEKGPRNIGPNATLIFEIELLDINSK